VLPRVCYQFYHLTRSYHDQCYQLYQYIPTLKKIICEKETVTILTCQKEGIRVCQIKSNDPFLQCLQLFVSRDVTCLHDLIPSSVENEYKIGIDIITTLPHNPMSQGYVPYPFVKAMDRLHDIFNQLSEDTLKKISMILIKHGQTILLHGELNLIHLKNDLFHCLSSNDIQGIEDAISPLLCGLTIHHFVSFFNNKSEKSLYYHHLLNVVSKPLEQVVCDLKVYLTHNEKLFTFSKENSLFFYQSPGLFSPCRWLPSNALDDKMQWLGQRLMN